MANLTYQVKPGGRMLGRARVPGDKSISHRALMLASLAQGQSTIKGFLNSADCLATLSIMRELGVTIDEVAPDHIIVHGVGETGFKTPATQLDCGNAGTACRLLAGFLVGQRIQATLTGDESLQKRPMARVVNPLTEMGANITSNDGRLPLVIHPSDDLHGIRYTLPVASAQVKSCLLLAGLGARGETEIIEPKATRDHTERMLQAFGYPIEVSDKRVSLQGGGKLQATDIIVPADISSAAFFIVGASLLPGNHVTLESVGINPTRRGIIDVLTKMGAVIKCRNERFYGSEMVADISVTGAPLRGCEIGGDLIPTLIDELPVIMVAAACARGTTTIAGARELRHKESDRLQVMADGLRTIGCDIELLEDGAIIQGVSGFSGGVIDSHYDHRIAMSFVIASLRANSPIEIRQAEAVETSFPNFAVMARRLGCFVEECVE